MSLSSSSIIEEIRKELPKEEIDVEDIEDCQHFIERSLVLNEVPKDDVWDFFDITFKINEADDKKMDPISCLIAKGGCVGNRYELAKRLVIENNRSKLTLETTQKILDDLNKEVKSQREQWISNRIIEIEAKNKEKPLLKEEALSIAKGMWSSEVRTPELVAENKLGDKCKAIIRERRKNGNQDDQQEEKICIEDARIKFDRLSLNAVDSKNLRESLLSRDNNTKRNGINHIDLEGLKEEVDVDRGTDTDSRSSKNSIFRNTENIDALAILKEKYLKMQENYSALEAKISAETKEKNSMIEKLSKTEEELNRIKELADREKAKVEAEKRQTEALKMQNKMLEEAERAMRAREVAEKEKMAKTKLEMERKAEELRKKQEEMNRAEMLRKQQEAAAAAAIAAEAARRAALHELANRLNL